MKYSELIVNQIKKFEKECQKDLQDPSFTFDYRIDIEGKEDTLYVDGVLYDIFTYGCSDFNFGSEFYEQIEKFLDDNKIIMENQSSGVFKFYKV